MSRYPELWQVFALTIPSIKKQVVLFVGVLHTAGFTLEFKFACTDVKSSEGSSFQNSTNAPGSPFACLIYPSNNGKYLWLVAPILYRTSAPIFFASPSMPSRGEG